MLEVHEGLCGAHQSGRRMAWLIKRYGYFWTTLVQDCIEYAKRCQECQRHRPIQKVPATRMQIIVKPWPFRMWAMHVIGMLFPSSSKGHRYLLLATDYFTKWVEAVPLKEVDQLTVVKFLKEHIIYRFGVPETIVSDQAQYFTGKDLTAFANEMGVTLTHSSPYFAQGNGQAEATNKIVKGIIQKTLEENPRDWHEALSQALWAYRTSQRGSTRTTPFTLVYGQDAVIPVERPVNTLRIMRQPRIDSEEYRILMLNALESIDIIREEARGTINKNKLKVEKMYNRRVKYKAFRVGDLVWRLLVPIGLKDPSLGKWSPN